MLKINFFKKYYLLLVIPIIIYLGLFGFGFDGLYGQDSYEYLRYANVFKNYLNTGTSPGDYFWPLYFPILGGLLDFIFNNMPFTLSLISAASLGLSGLYCYKIIVKESEYSNKAFWYILLFLILSPSVFRLGMVAMSDMLSLNFTILSVFWSLHFSKTHKTKALYLACLFGISAVMTRYATFVVLLPFCVFLIYLFFKLKKSNYHIIGLLLLIIILLVPHISLRLENSTSFLSHSWLKDWSFINFYSRTFDTQDGIANYKFPNIFYAFSNSFHPRYLFLGFVFLILFFTKSIKNKYSSLLFVSYILYSLFIAGIPFQNTRFLLLSYPFILILLYPSYDFICNKLQNRITIAGLLIILVLICQISLSYIAFKPIYARNQLEQKIAKTIKPYQKNTLYSFDIDISLLGRQLEFDYKNLWIDTYKTIKPGSLVLFNEQKFSKQWKDKNPMLNWSFINENYTLEIIKTYNEGWVLYQIL